MKNPHNCKEAIAGTTPKIISLIYMVKYCASSNSTIFVLWGK
jgi:hypothetical protein